MACMYRCMCVYTNIFMNIHTLKHTHLHTHAHTHKSLHSLNIFVYTYIHSHTEYVRRTAHSAYMSIFAFMHPLPCAPKHTRTHPHSRTTTYPTTHQPTQCTHSANSGTQPHKYTHTLSQKNPNPHQQHMHPIHS